MNLVKKDHRIEELDYLRGFALLGILLVNILPLLSVSPPLSDTFNATYQRFLYLFVEGRFFAIFSFLFGVSFYIFIYKANDKGKNAKVLFLRRIMCLFAMGAIHLSFHPGEALTVYSVYGLLVLPFYNVKKEVNLFAGLFLLFIFSVLSIKILLPLPLILLGLTAGQYKVFENLMLYRRKIYIYTLITFSLSALLFVYQYNQVPSKPFDIINMENVDSSDILQITKFINTGIMIGAINSAFYIGMLLTILKAKSVRLVLAPLKYLGQMGLTNYIGQTAILITASHLFGIYNQISYLQTLFICQCIILFQVIFSVIWLRYFKYGPLEWGWSMFTYSRGWR
ncbi:DUF418 domain-containing protein [Pseudobacillus badius]|uniref:DUF418 domain-containing protein n=1 Tax=Bacillus badius TaxID=1455 RepID=UPI003D32A74D